MAHPKKQLLFALLSLADLVLTCWLLDGPGGVYEANPVARWWLDRFGWAGLAGFKAAAVGLVIALALLIARSRPRAAGMVLGLGCAITAAVVLYSASLLRTAHCPEPRFAESEVAAMNREARQAHQGRMRFYAELAEKARELSAGRLRIEEAAGWAAGTDRGRDPAWRRSLLATRPGRPLREAFAACVMGHAVSSIAAEDLRAAAALAGRLSREFERAYGSPTPFAYRVAPDGKLASWGPRQVASLGRGP
jgi:hypothetical protein